MARVEDKRVPEHFDVDAANEVLLDLFGRNILLAELSFELSSLFDDDFILFLFGPSFSNSFDKVAKVWTKVRS